MRNALAFIVYVLWYRTQCRTEDTNKNIPFVMYVFSVSIISGRKTSMFLHFLSFRHRMNKYILESIVQKITNYGLKVKKSYIPFFNLKATNLTYIVIVLFKSRLAAASTYFSLYLQ